MYDVPMFIYWYRIATILILSEAPIFFAINKYLLSHNDYEKICNKKEKKD